MTIETIIDSLGKDGINSKKTVLEALKTSDIDELRELKMSIQDRINYLIMKKENINNE